MQSILCYIIRKKRTIKESNFIFISCLVRNASMVWYLLCKIYFCFSGLIPPLSPTHHVSCVARINNQQVYHQITMNIETFRKI
jgi:hypothetical protein